MTSLFRRSSSNGGGEGGQLNNSRPSRQVRRLEFNQAMEDFRTMFPSMDYEVIECVLRSNNGAVDATIDQLLQMSVDGQGSDDSSDSDDSIPAEILERTLEPDSSDEEPPPVYSPPAYDVHMFDRKYPEAPPTPPPRLEAEPHQQGGRYRNWNPPLLGRLPDDFLRILPQQSDSIKGSQSGLTRPSSSSSSASSISRWTTRSGSQLGPAGTAGGQGLPAGATEQDRKLKQYLEDERIALFLQNEEFMRELQRNREFLVALERGSAVLGASGNQNVSSASLQLATAGRCPCTCLRPPPDGEEKLCVLEPSGCGGRSWQTTPSPDGASSRPNACSLFLDRLKYESKRSKSAHSSGAETSTGLWCVSAGDASLEAVSDEALFRDKLKHMGKSTRKKLFEIARTFSEKTKRRKSRRKVLLKRHSYPRRPPGGSRLPLSAVSSLTQVASRLGTAASTANLLDDVEG
ncbi:unnamed protein product, partial [Tetraodon nigroviridis]